MVTTARRFDAQAGSFDRRAGLPPVAVQAVADAVLATAEPTVDGVLLEVGAGTGEIGAALATGGMAYLGLDLSLSMLARFSARLRALPRFTGRGALAQADADRPWPLGARARIVFVSRALHLLDFERVSAETVACRHPRGCAVVVGRVRRDPDGVRGMLRRQMRSLLAAHGITGKSGERAQGRWLAALSPHGGRPRPPQTVATWTAEVRPAEVIANWRHKPGLAGESVPPELQAEVLDRLEDWARANLGDLATPRPAVESYELAVVDLPSQREAGA
jgi:methyltransferase family protein